MASGVGQGLESRTAEDGAVVSWVTALANLLEVDNVWNHSLPGKPIGLVHADFVEFHRQYIKRYGTSENLTIILEYSMPSYRHWDPVAASRSDCMGMNIVPLAQFSPIMDWEKARSSAYYRDAKFLQTEFYERREIDMLAVSRNAGADMYQKVTDDVILPDEVLDFEARALEWFRPTEENKLRYMKYAFDELGSAQRLCNHWNTAYLQTWAGGFNDDYKRGVDRFLKPLSQGNPRLIPMQEFTSITATNDWSDKVWRNHPDEVGHKRIAEYFYNYIKEHKIYERPNNNLYRGYTSE